MGRILVIEYRAYILDAGGHITKSIPLVCRDDAEAVAAARQADAESAIEIWSGARFVARLEAQR